jgi:hypothetical protein
VFLIRTNIEQIVAHRGLDNAEFVNADKRHLLHFWEPREISKIFRAGKLDPWSELFFSSRMAGGLMHVGDRPQNELDLVWG